MKVLKYHFIIISLIVNSQLFAQLTTKPTFCSCSVYLPYTNDFQCKIFFKKTCDKSWIESFSPVYDNEKKEFRGSIVKLDENTQYDIKAIILKKGKIKKKFNSTFKTWDSNPTISKTLNISDFRNPTGSSYQIDHIEGTPDGWIKIKGNVDINAIDTEDDYAVSITNSKYVILEGITVIGGEKYGIFIPKTSSQIRILNCDISKWGRASNYQRVDGVYLDKNNEKINFDGGIKILEAEDIVIERCYIHDSKAKTNPWTGVVEDGPYKGTAYRWTHPEGPSGIYCKQAKGGIVIRYNDIVGNQLHRFNDAIETADNGGKNGGFNKDADIYGNVMAFGQDDGIELDGGQCNVRLFNNRIEQTYCGISTAPNTTGPSYIFNNIVWNLGNSLGDESVSVKNGGGPTYSKGKQFFFNNTMIVTKNGLSGIGFGNDEKREIFNATTRNNIFVSKTEPKFYGSRGNGLSISDIHKSQWNDFDFDMIGNTISPAGKGVIIAKDSSEINGIFTIPHFQDLEHAVFTLKSTDPGIHKGEIIPNFSEGYDGKAPDMGAYEFNTSSLFPKRPLDVTADKYFIKLEYGAPQKISIKVGNLNKSNRIKICKSEDMSWIDIEVDSYDVNSNSEIILTLNAKNTCSQYINMGMIFVRFDDGLSVPITVFAK